MKKDKFIKYLEQIPGNPHIGVCVLEKRNKFTGVNENHFWGIEESMGKPMDGGTTFSLMTLRQRAAIPDRLLLKQRIFSVDDVNVTVDELVKRFGELFDVTDAIKELPDGKFQEFILETLKYSIQDMVRLNESFIRVFGNKPEHKSFKLME